MRVLRNYGSRIKYVNEVTGYNSRLDPLQAAVLRVKLTVLDEWNERRRVIAGRYLAGLGVDRISGADRASGVSGNSGDRDEAGPSATSPAGKGAEDRLVLPQVLAGADPVWHLFVIRHPRRDELQQSLTQAGIPRRQDRSRLPSGGFV
jgi:dTDP-4-amino-4,6-dideoxygalactose transaminase